MFIDISFTWGGDIWVEGLLETTDLHEVSGKICIQSTLPEPTLWDFTQYIIIDLAHHAQMKV